MMLGIEAPAALQASVNAGMTRRFACACAERVIEMIGGQEELARAALLAARLLAEGRGQERDRMRVLRGRLHTTPSAIANEALAAVLAACGDDDSRVEEAADYAAFAAAMREPRLSAIGWLREREWQDGWWDWMLTRSVVEAD